MEWYYIAGGVYVILFLLGYWKVSEIDARTREMHEETMKRVRKK